MRSRLCFSLLLLLFAAAPAMGHPLPDFRYDRIIDIRLHPRKVEVRYTLMQSFKTINADNRKLFTPQEIEQMGGDTREATKRYCQKMAPILAEKLEAKIGNKRLIFHTVKLELQPDSDHGKFRYVFEAPWVVNGGGAENTFTFEDHNFEDACGAITLVTEEEKGLNVKYNLDPDTLRGKQPSELKPGEAELARKTSAVFTAPSLPPLPPEIVATTQVKEPEPPAASQRETDPQVVVIENKPEEDLPLLLPSHEPKTPFDTNYGTGVLLLLAAMAGAFHAFAPGHGKNAAASLVGEQSSVRRAILLGLSTTFAHTGSVILIAGILYLRDQDIVPQDAQNRLGLIGGGGLLVFFVAMWLFMSRLRGPVDHVHLFGRCSDMCGNPAVVPTAPQCRVPLRDAEPTADQSLQLHTVPQRTSMSWFRVMLLGIGAGAIPCVDAVLLLMLAISAGKLAFALPLLISFSIGLSAVLVLLSRAGRRFTECGWLRLLPTASAVLLMGMGLWMARDALKSFVAVG